MGRQTGRLVLAMVGAIAVLVAACSSTPAASTASAVTLTQTVEAAVVAVTITDSTPATTVTAISSAAAPAGLEIADQPWTLTVIGDSTGTQANGWVHYLGKRLGQAYQRSVTIYDWDLDCECYDDGTTTEYATSTAAEILVWNGSAAGKTAGYALDLLDEMVPEQPNLVIINHGHNNGTSEEAVAEIGETATTLTDLYGPDLPIYITQQNPRIDFGADKASATADQLAAEFGAGPYRLIDVFDAFEATGDLESVLTDDGLHPSEPGSVLWAEVAANALGVPDS